MLLLPGLRIHSDIALKRIVCLLVSLAELFGRYHAAWECDAQLHACACMQACSHVYWHRVLSVAASQILDDEDGDAGLAELARQRTSALAARQQAQQADEGEQGWHPRMPRYLHNRQLCLRAFLAIFCYSRAFLPGSMVCMFKYPDARISMHMG